MFALMVTVLAALMGTGLAGSVGVHGRLRWPLWTWTGRNPSWTLRKI